MTAAKAVEILKQIATPGSDLNARYMAWRSNQFSGMIFDLMFHLSTPDKVTEGLVIPEGADSSSMILGVCVGRSKAIDMIQMLDELVPVQKEEVEETFENQENIADET